MGITNCPDKSELNDLDLDKDGFLSVEEANSYKLESVNGNVEDTLAMMEVLSLCDTNGDDRLSLVEARICEVCLDSLYCRMQR